MNNVYAKKCFSKNYSITTKKTRNGYKINVYKGGCVCRGGVVHSMHILTKRHFDQVWQSCTHTYWQEQISWNVQDNIRTPPIISILYKIAQNQIASNRVLWPTLNSLLIIIQISSIFKTKNILYNCIAPIRELFALAWKCGSRSSRPRQMSLSRATTDRSVTVLTFLRTFASEFSCVSTAVGSLTHVHKGHARSKTG